MRWTLRIVALLALLLAGYTAWPFVDLYRLGRAVERADGPALSRRIEMNALRPSIARQVLATYLRLTGNEAGLADLLHGGAFGFGAAIANRALGSLIELDQIVSLLRQAFAGAGGDAGRPAGIAPADLGGLWTLYASSEYRLTRFSVAVPPALPPEQRLRLHLKLTQWRWKLYGVDLPEPLRLRLAAMLVKAGERPTPK
jgi:hypothetical protein